LSPHIPHWRMPSAGRPLMKKLSVLWIIIGAAFLTAAPVSIQPSSKSVLEISVNKADALVYRRHYRRAYRRSYYGYGYGYRGAYYGASYPRIFGYGPPAPYYGYPAPYYAYTPYPYGAYPPVGGAIWPGFKF
jgi:hypothetical protein